jgi:thiamine-phosphate pyrophosphorylase
LCVVTDRRRLPDPSPAGLIAFAVAAAEAGISIIQVRERELSTVSLIDTVRALVDAVSHTGTRVIVNERADIARAAGAHGVHLRADSALASRVRAVSPDEWVIGRSVHTVEEARAAGEDGGADYLFFGTVFQTASKHAGHPIAGVQKLSEVCSAVALPVVGIGGITAENAGHIAGAGAAGVAGIGLFADAWRSPQPVAADPAGRIGLVDLVSRLRRAFDS